MDAEPKALRISIVLTIAFVLFGVIAGSFLFLLGRDTAMTGGTLAGAELDAVKTRPMSPPARLDAAERAKIDQWIPIAMTYDAPDDRRAAGESLLELGAMAVPSLLDVVHRMASGPHGFEPVEARDGMRNADAILRRLRLRLTPESPADPMPPDPNSTWLTRRAKSWFIWWDRYAAMHPEFN